MGPMANAANAGQPYFTKTPSYHAPAHAGGEGAQLRETSLREERAGLAETPQPQLLDASVLRLRPCPLYSRAPSERGPGPEELGLLPRTQSCGPRGEAEGVGGRPGSTLRLPLLPQSPPRSSAWGHPLRGVRVRARGSACRAPPTLTACMFPPKQRHPPPPPRGR